MVFLRQLSREGSLLTRKAIMTCIVSTSEKILTCFRIGFFLGVGGLVLVFGHRLQVDSWKYVKLFSKNDNNLGSEFG